MDDDSRAILAISAVLTVCGYAVIIGLVYLGYFVFVGGFLIGLILLAPMLSYLLANVFLMTEELNMW